MSPSYGIERLTVSFCFQTSHGKNTATTKMAAWPKGQDGTQGQGQGVEAKGEAPMDERRSRIPIGTPSAYFWHKFWKGTGNGKGKGKSKTEEDATGAEENATGAEDWLHMPKPQTGCGNPSHHVMCKGTRDPSCKWEFVGSFAEYLEVLHPTKRARTTDDGP